MSLQTNTELGTYAPTDWLSITRTISEDGSGNKYASVTYAKNGELVGKCDLPTGKAGFAPLMGAMSAVAQVYKNSGGGVLEAIWAPHCARNADLSAGMALSASTCATGDMSDAPITWVSKTGGLTIPAVSAKYGAKEH